MLHLILRKIASDTNIWNYLSWRCTCVSFEGVCVNYRNPGPRRGKRKVGSAPPVAFPADPVDPVDLDQNSGRLILTAKNK